MSYEFDIELEYSGGQVLPSFIGDEYPENWTEMQTQSEMEVKDALFEIADIHEWRDSFETAREYSMPGMSPEPEVGTITISDDTVTVNLSISSIDDCDWM